MVPPTVCDSGRRSLLPIEAPRSEGASAGCYGEATLPALLALRVIPDDRTCHSATSSSVLSCKTIEKGSGSQHTWLARHPRYHVHFTPTSASWLNLVERLFAEVTDRCVRRGSHTAVRELEKAMLDYLDRRNRDPKPFVWTADADLILGKVERLCQRISDSGH